jgi:hypothetical protein
VTEPNLADTKAAVARLVERGQAIPLPDPVHVGAVIDGTIERLTAENEALRERIRAARQDVFPLLRTTGLLGELARNIEAALDPQPEPEAHPDRRTS